MDTPQDTPHHGPHYPGSATTAPSERAAAVSAASKATARIGLSLLALAALALATGCGREVKPAPARASRVDTPAAWPTVTPADPAKANAVLMRAISLVGTPYRYGGSTPQGGFDCSGLVNYVYRDMLDLRLPRTSRDLAAYQGPRIAPARLATADLVFFGSGGNVSHVGIYVGEGRFVHAPTTGGTVRLDRLDGPYWRDHYSGAKRVLH